MTTQTMLRIFWVIMMIAPLNTARAEGITLYAAGSLKTALGEVLTAYRQQHGIAITSQFGPSGILREAIETGENVFSSSFLKLGKMLISLSRRICHIHKLSPLKAGEKQ